MLRLTVRGISDDTRITEAGSRYRVRGPDGAFGHPDRHRPVPDRAADAMGRASCARRERQSRPGFPGFRRPAGPASSPARETGGASVRVSGGAWGLFRFRRAALSALLGLAAFAAAPQGASADPCPGDIVPPGTFWSACMTPAFQDNRIQTLSGYRRTAGYGSLSDITVDSAAGTLTVQIPDLHFQQARELA